MKLSIAIADTNALPSAFVVYRGFNESIPKAAQLGYDGVELALKRVDEIDEKQLRYLLEMHRMEVSCISTGQVYADGGLMFTHPERQKREEVKQAFRELIDLAQTFGQTVNIGRVRGQIGDRPREEVEHLFIETARELCKYARLKGVTLVLEPVNRYECDFINTVGEGVSLIKKVGESNLMLMPDVFHMNIEEKEIGQEIIKHLSHVKYVHFADSNRLAPGQGHLDFEKLLHELAVGGYDGWITLEILPKPDPDTAASQAINFLLPLVHKYTSNSLTPPSSKLKRLF